MIGLIAKIFVALNSNSRPGEIASAISFGLWLTLIPGGNLLWFVLLTVAFFLKHNIAALFLTMAVLRLVIPLADPLLDTLGGLILYYPGLHGVFTYLYNLPFGAFTAFNNTIVTGGFLAGMLFWLPVFFLVVFAVKIYRKYIASKLADSRLIRFFKRAPLLSRLARAIELEGPL